MNINRSKLKIILSIKVNSAHKHLDLIKGYSTVPYVETEKEIQTHSEAELKSLKDI